ncbi:MAG: stage 0 sporulation family protein [Acutalibacteraceae bacterium]|nr:stage 0 sporulation family protein [Acutalibacteraceae bacterium]
MTEVISVRFKDVGKNYYFSPDGKKYAVGENVIVETANGLAFGTVAEPNHDIEDERIVPPLKKALRVANEKDYKRLEENEAKQADALKICEQKIAARNLDMKLVNAEYSFDGGKITFFFTADGRVDFRELVKDLANHFHARIELRQIGVRDEAKMLGGIGICGQPYCCKRFLDDFLPVSIKMAKEQGLSLNPTKISGSCGRLMCCLNYEQDSYEYLNSITPSVGATVKTENGIGVVSDVNLITGNLTVKLKDGEGAPFKTNRKYVKVLSSGKGKRPENNKE